MRWLTCLAALAVTLGSVCHAADVLIRIDNQYRHIDAGPLPGDQWKDIETDLSSKAAQVLTVHVGKLTSFNSRPVLGAYSRVDNQLRGCRMLFDSQFHPLTGRHGLSHACSRVPSRLRRIEITWKRCFLALLDCPRTC